MTARIVVVGSLNADFVVTVPRVPAAGETVQGTGFAVVAGGKGANQAYAAARLGATVAMIGQVGNDAHGAWLKQQLAGGGVDVGHVGTDAAVPTGIAVIALEASGQNRIIIVPGANGSFDPERLEASTGLLSSADIVLLQLEIPLPTVTRAARIAKQAGAIVILDPAPARPLDSDLLALVDYLTPNETEAATLTGTPAADSADRAGAAAQAAKLRARGARRVIMKMGGRGALLFDGQAEQFWPAIPVAVVDTTAAGDAFNAAFAVALAEGRRDAEAGAFATVAAACSVTRAGAQPSMPVRAEVEAMLRRGRA